MLRPLEMYAFITFVFLFNMFQLIRENKTLTHLNLRSNNLGVPGNCSILPVHDNMMKVD